MYMKAFIPSFLLILVVLLPNCKNDSVETDPSVVVYSIEEQYNALEDTFVRDGEYASENYGDEWGIHVKKANENSGYNRISYIKFDVSEIRATLLTATLQIKGSMINGEQAVCSLYFVEDNSWQELTMTWTNKPSATQLISEFTVTPSETGSWYEFDVTDWVNQALLSDHLVSFSIDKPEDEEANVYFESRENGDECPHLLISQEVHVDTSKQTLIDKTLAPHPRILVNQAQFEQTKQAIQSDSQIKNGYESIQKRADELLQSTPVTYTIPDGIRLLQTSREVLKRMIHFGFMYKMTDESKYPDRAWEELQAAAAFPDWNPSHFLDTAEMTMAFAIGYDWFFEYFDENQKQHIREAMIKHGLQIALDSYQGKVEDGVPWWVTAENNWNVVCNGGISAGALAIGLDEPTFVYQIETILRTTQTMIKEYMMPSFAPDGGWHEGPGYWEYTLNYFFFYVQSLQLALQDDFGFLDAPGVSQTGDFPLYLQTPIDQSFSFADANTDVFYSTVLFWLAKQFNKPQYGWLLYKNIQDYVTPLDLLFYDENYISTTIESDVPLDRHFQNVEVGVFRSGFEDSQAYYVGFKAGDNQANHGDLDIGSFVFDALGVRWADDIGSENYNLPGYWDMGADGQRWTYYRKRAEGHNTLVMNPSTGPDQDPFADAHITTFQTDTDHAYAVLDVTPAYAAHATSVKRGFYLYDQRSKLLLQDEWLLKEPGTVYWFFHTEASIEIQTPSNRAILSKDNVHVYIEILEPVSASFTRMDAVPLPESPNPSDQTPNPDLQKLVLRFDSSTQETLKILCIPYRESMPTAPFGNIDKPLAEW